MAFNQKGFSIIELLLVFGAAVVITGVGYMVYSNSTSSHTSTPTPKSCHDKDGVSMCLSASDSKVSSSDEVTLTTTIINRTSKAVTEVFSCTATDPSILLNKQDLSLGTGCNQTITPKSIKAHGQESFETKLSGSKLKTGKNTLKAVWGDFESSEITLEKRAVSSHEISDQFNTCQSLKDNIEYSEVPGFCESIDIVLENSNAGQYSCQKWKSLFKQLTLAIPCDSVMDIGVGYVYVPRDDSAKWLEKIQTLPEVSSASIDNQ